MKKTDEITLLGNTIASEEGSLSELVSEQDDLGHLIDQETNLLDVAAGGDTLPGETQPLDTATPLTIDPSVNIKDAPPIISVRDVPAEVSQTHLTEASEFLDPVDLSLIPTDADTRGLLPEDDRLPEENNVFNEGDDFQVLVPTAAPTGPVDDSTFIFLDQVEGDDTPSDGFSFHLTGGGDPYIDFSGRGEAGATVTLQIFQTDPQGNLIEIESVTDIIVGDDGQWTTSVSALDDGDYTITASIVHGAGNQDSVDNTLEIIPLSTITVDNLTADNVLAGPEIEEFHGLYQLTVTVGGGARPGDTVTITTPSGTVYQTQVFPDNTYQAIVNIDDLDNIIGINDGNYQLEATVNNVSTVKDYTIDQSTFVNVVNINDAGDQSPDNGFQVTNTGQVTDYKLSGNLEVGNSILGITVTYNNGNDNATISGITVDEQAGTWEATFTAVTEFDDKGRPTFITNYEATLNTSDPFENVAVSQQSIEIVENLPIINIDNITADNILTGPEIDGLQGGVYTVTGTVGGGTNPGDTLIFTTQNGEIYSFQIGNKNSYSVDIAASDLGSANDGDYQLTATIGTTSVVKDYSVDQSTFVNLSQINGAGDEIAGSNVFEVLDGGRDRTYDLSGSLEVGNNILDVTVRSDNGEASAISNITVDANSGTWSATFTAVDATNYSATITTTDPFGNTDVSQQAIEIIPGSLA